MTLNELKQDVSNWFEEGALHLVNEEIGELTIGQGIFTIFAVLGAVIAIYLAYILVVGIVGNYFDNRPKSKFYGITDMVKDLKEHGER